MENKKKVRFKGKNPDDFLKTLNSRVKEYLKENHLTKNGSKSLYIKGLVLLIIGVMLYLTLFYGWITIVIHP